MSSRETLLQKELIEYHPKKWKINIPGLQYKIHMEDFVPALSGSIGKVSLVAAFAVAWSTGFKIVDPTFVTENVRLEIFIASILTLLFCALLNPFAGPPGTLAPLAPLIPVMIASGVHPLPLSLLIGVFGILLSSFKYFTKIVALNGPGTKGGIILLFGFMGVTSSINSLKTWATTSNVPDALLVLLFVGILLYVVLNYFGYRWLIIPACAVVALIVALLFQQFPTFKTGVGLPILNPNTWWNVKWGIGFGLTPSNFIAALPFAILAVVLWPIDALAIKTIQETNYPKEAKNAIFDMNGTYIIVSLRNIIGVLFGGGQIAAIWRSFMIPLGIVKRPIGGSAFLLGILGLSFAFLGFPIDIAVFPPLLWMVLIFGVYIPLMEVGLSTIKSNSSVQIAALCFIAGIGINPVIGWLTGVLIENFGLIKDTDNPRILSKQDKTLTLVIGIVTLTTYLLTFL